MNIKQSGWAATHDWYLYTFQDVDSAPGDLSVCVVESGTKLVDGESVEYSERHVFSDYKALRDWAGY